MTRDTRCQWCEAPATAHVGTRLAHCDAHREWPAGAVCEACAETDALSTLVTGNPWRASNGASS